MESTNFKQLVEVAAVCTTILQFLSGSLVCKKVILHRSPGDTSAFPFICGLLSSTLWLTYGMLKHDSSVILVNSIGTILQLSYVTVFYKYSSKKSNILYQFLLICIVLTLFFVYLNFEDDKASALYFTGLFSCVVTLIFIAAPLVMLVHVLKVRSTESLPFPVILMTFFVSALWYIYGSIINDDFMKVPNAIGAILAASQLSLFVFLPSTTNIKYSRVPHIT